MIRMRVLSGVVAGLLTAAVSAQEKPGTSVDLVLLDIVVTNRDGAPMTDLRTEDFEIKEDGKGVEIKSFSAMTAAGSTRPSDGRSVVLLLDDSGVPASGTIAMRSIARGFLSLARVGDEVSVVRLHGRSDEPYGDMRVALNRIAEYQAASMPFADWETPEYALGLLANLSRQLESVDSRRKLIVCIGSVVVCNVAEPPRDAPRSLYKNWVDAIAATARANVGVYAFIPGSARLRGGGIVDITGGEVLASSSDIGPAIDRIWTDASHYYLVGYWPGPSSRDLHSINVKVARKGAHVRVRRTRGN